MVLFIHGRASPTGTAGPTHTHTHIHTHTHRCALAHTHTHTHTHTHAHAHTHKHTGGSTHAKMIRVGLLARRLPPVGEFSNVGSETGKLECEHCQ